MEPIVEHSCIYRSLIPLVAFSAALFASCASAQEFKKTYDPFKNLGSEQVPLPIQMTPNRSASGPRSMWSIARRVTGLLLKGQTIGRKALKTEPISRRLMMTAVILGTTLTKSCSSM